MKVLKCDVQNDSLKMRVSRREFQSVLQDTVPRWEVEMSVSEYELQYESFKMIVSKWGFQDEGFETKVFWMAFALIHTYMQAYARANKQESKQINMEREKGEKWKIKERKGKGKGQGEGNGNLNSNGNEYRVLKKKLKGS